MKKTAQKIKSSTQKFIEIDSISDNIVFLSGGNAALIIEITATNFELLSVEEQNAKIASYVAFLNSLSFSIQIFIRSKQLDISSYLKLLETQEITETNTIVKERIRLYKEFVAEMIKVNTVLDKKFYIVVSFSYIEKGISKASSATQKNVSSTSDFQTNARASLHTKAEGIQSQMTNLNLKTKILQGDELMQLFYEVYNGDSVQALQVGRDTQSPVVKTI